MGFLGGLIERGGTVASQSGLCNIPAVCIIPALEESMTNVTHLIQDLELVAGTEPRLANLMQRTISALIELSKVTPENGVGRDEIPYKVITELYNSILGSVLQPAVRMPPGRKMVIAARWREDETHQSIEFWDKFFKRVAASDFLMGRSARGAGHENWMPNFDWLLKSAPFTKILEGGHDNRGPRANADRITRFR
jgi:hypothetical protein